NMLSVEELATIFGGLRHVFHVAPDAEIAAELDPAVLSRDWIRAAAYHGLSRASLGVQNLAPEVQSAVNRQEKFEDIAECVGTLREAGVVVDRREGLWIHYRINPALPAWAREVLNVTARASAESCARDRKRLKGAPNRPPVRCAG
ncbi:MAG: hypothetical protein ACK4ZN_15590, partial [Oceanibaculum sp.]